MNRSENTILLACLARYDKLLTTAIEQVGRYALFDNLSDQYTAFIWSALQDIKLSSGTFPVRAMLETELEGRLDSTLGLGDAFRQTIAETVEAIYNIPEDDLSEEAGQYYLDIALDEALTTGWASKLRRLETVEEMKAYVTEVSSDISKLNSKEDAWVKPLATPELFLVKKERTPFGVRVLDLVTAGGLAPGESLGILGPTGGGKTVMAVGLTCERAKRKQHVTLVTYEQQTEGDIMERLCTYMTGLEIDNFRDKNFTDLTDEVREKLSKEQAKYAEYLSVIDLAKGTGGTGGAEEVIAHINRQFDKSEGPSLVVVDWLGSMVQRYLAFNNIGSDEYRHVAHQFMDKLTNHARAKGYSLVINHQLKTDAARRRPEVKPNVTEAMEVRSFAFFLDGCVCLGTLSTDTHVGWLCMNKFRRGAPTDVLIKLIGSYMRFEPADGFVVDHRGLFIPEDESPPDVDEMQENTAMQQTYEDEYAT